MTTTLHQVLRELRFMFGPAAPVMLLCYLAGARKAFVGIDREAIVEWCQLRKVM